MAEIVPETVEEWLALAAQARRMAQMAMTEAITRKAAWDQAGFALECVLKAAIMSKERWNRFPDRSVRRDLYTHDLTVLLSALGASVEADDLVAPAWSVVVQWRRDHMYKSEMPEAVVRGLMVAVFGEVGVIEWLSQSYLKSFLKAGGSIFPS